MKIQAGELQSKLDRVKQLGASKIESSSIVLYRDEFTGELLFAVSSRSTHLNVRSGILIGEGDNFIFEGAISLNLGTINSIISGMKELEIEVRFNPTNSAYIQIISDVEKYDIAYTAVSDTDANAIFNVSLVNAKVLVKDELVANIVPIGTIIHNINLLCVDSQFKTILHRKGNSLRAVFITSTTLNVFSVSLQSHPEYTESADYDFGIDTKSVFVPRALAQILLYLKDDNDRVNISYDDTSIFISTTDALLRTTYETKQRDISKSVAAYHNMKTIVDMLNKKVLILKVDGYALDDMIKKASVLIGKGTANKLTSYVPLYVVSPTEVMVSYKSTSGSYTSNIKTNINIEGLTSTYQPSSAMFNMSVPMMTSILTTVNKTFGKARVIIELKESDDNKIYVKAYSESSDKIIYYMRLKK